MEGGTIFMN